MGAGQGNSSVVEHVLSKFEALGSILSLKKEKWKVHMRRSLKLSHV